jgi:hypothetical protein
LSLVVFDCVYHSLDTVCSAVVWCVVVVVICEKDMKKGEWQSRAWKFRRVMSPRQGRQSNETI